MTAIMELLYEYTQDYCVEGFLDRRAYGMAQLMEEKNLTALKTGLSSERLSALERYQQAQEDSRSLELEAMFLAAFSVARELR